MDGGDGFIDPLPSYIQLAIASVSLVRVNAVGITQTLTWSFS
jgi:hypothetical protein